MLRGPPSARNPAPISLEPEEDAHYPRLLQAGPSRLYEEREQHQNLMYEPYETTPSRSTRNSLSPTVSRHQRQRSVPNFTSRRLNTPPLSPSRGHSRQASQGMPLTGDVRGGTSPNRLTGWLSGTSTPASSVDGDGIPMSHTIRGSVETTPKSTAQSRLGFLASSVSAFTSRMTSPTQAPVRYDDDLCNLDIEAALFPASSPLDTDTFSPAAYKNLQANATGLLHKMQDAYRQRTVAFREMQAEREAHKEEMEETELRARNFKSQLEKMAAKAAENEKAMQQLVAELQAEKRARHEERMARDKMFRTAAAAAAVEAAAVTTIIGEEDGSVVACNEDLCVDEDERKRWRKSNSTVKSELSIDTDGDVDSAESESIFSRSRSPTAMTCITENESLSLEPSPTLHPKSAAKPRPAQPPQQLTAFQRLVKGIAAVNKDEAADSADGCRNCRGQNASVAWDTVSLLRDENIALKRRVAQLDNVVEGALDIVNGIKI